MNVKGKQDALVKLKKRMRCIRQKTGDARSVKCNLHIETYGNLGGGSEGSGTGGKSGNNSELHFEFVL